MSSKPFLDFRKLIIRIWLILWATLGILLIMKYCFNIWYPIIIESEKMWFINDFLDNHWLLKIIIASAFYYLNVVIILMTTTLKKKLNYKILILFIPLSIIAVILKDKTSIIGYLFDFVLSIVIPIIYNMKNKTFSKKWLNILFPVIINVFCLYGN